MKLISFLVVFAVSFFIRGIFDTIQHFISFDGQVVGYVMLVVLYFGCEWLPLFFIFYHHKNDFDFERQQKTGGLKKGPSLLVSPVNRRKNSTGDSFTYGGDSTAELNVGDTSRDSKVDTSASISEVNRDSNIRVDPFYTSLLSGGSKHNSSI